MAEAVGVPNKLNMNKVGALHARSKLNMVFSLGDVESRSPPSSRRLKEKHDLHRGEFFDED